MMKPYTVLKKSVLSAGMLSLAIFSPVSLAELNHDTGSAQVKVTWGDYTEFTDIKSANESRKRFAERTFANLEKYIAKLARDLPEGHQLSIKVIDLDLAGRVLPASFAGLGMHTIDNIRVIKNIDIPRVKLSYVYTGADGVELKQGEVNIKDMSFLSHHNPVSRSDSLKYEKNMLRKWFNETFIDA